eukprot:jgi/Orpsp1_1/1188752/evm.model.d7180000066963.1
MLLSLCTGKKYRKNKKKYHNDIDDDVDDENIAPVIFQQKIIDLPSHPQFDNELETKNKKKGITIYVGGQLTPAIPPNFNFINSSNDDSINYNHDQFDIDNAAINDEAPPKIKPRNESYGQKILDTNSITSISFSDMDKSIISHRRYSSQINRHSISSSHIERNRRYSAGPDNSFYGKASEHEHSHFNYFNPDVITSNNFSYEVSDEDDNENNLSQKQENQNLTAILKENNINTNNDDYEPQPSTYDLSNINYSINEIENNMNINNDNNELIEKKSLSEETSSSTSNSESRSKTYDTNRTSQSESGSSQSVTENSESTESEMNTKCGKSMNKSDGNMNSGINNDTTLKDVTNSVNKDFNDEVPTLTNNKDSDITENENDIDAMNSEEKLKYIENSYDLFMSNAQPSVANNKEEYSNQNNNAKITDDLNEYSLQDESSLFDDAPREIRATYPIPSPKKKIKILVFGSKDSWYIQYENGEESWNNLPTFLQWRLE